MKYIKQRHTNGCGVAALAMVTGISYDRALKLIDPKRKSGTKYPGTSLEQALKTFTKMGIKYQIHFDTKLKDIKNNAYVSASLPCGCRHAVVWDAENKKILDPDTTEIGHEGGVVCFSRQYVEKSQNYIVEIIPS
jgi:ABC-type bacteriocin/lantibiotic exporter with double-glycine peptidase domain